MCWFSSLFQMSEINVSASRLTNDTTILCCFFYYVRVLFLEPPTMYLSQYVYAKFSIRFEKCLLEHFEMAFSDIKLQLCVQSTWIRCSLFYSFINVWSFFLHHALSCSTELNTTGNGSCFLLPGKVKWSCVLFCSTDCHLVRQNGSPTGSNRRWRTQK